MSALATLRERVADANRALGATDLVTLSFGNVSGVDREAGVLVIKPSGVPYAELDPAKMVVVALDDGRVVDGGLRPSTDTPTHRALYRAFPGIGGVVHTHAPVATAWAQAGRPIPCLGTTHADYFRGEVPVSRALTAAEVDGDYEAATGDVIVETLRVGGREPDDCPGILVASHGPFTWGASPEAAVEHALALELIAGIAFRTLSIEAAVRDLDPALVDRHFLRKHGAAAYYGQVTAATRDG